MVKEKYIMWILIIVLALVLFAIVAVSSATIDFFSKKDKEVMGIK